MNQEVKSKPELERRSKRRFSGTEKLRLLAEFKALAHGEKGAWLRRNGLYAGQISLWQQAAVVGEAALEPQTPGRKALSEVERENRRLLAENAKLKDRVRIAEGFWNSKKTPGTAASALRGDELMSFLADRPKGTSLNRARDALGVARHRLYPDGRKARARNPKVPRASRAPDGERTLSDSERAKVLEVLQSERFVDCSPRQVESILLSEGKRLCSTATMYRLLAHAQQTNRFGFFFFHSFSASMGVMWPKARCGMLCR